jgi:DNA replication protein DnaC
MNSLTPETNSPSHNLHEQLDRIGLRAVGAQLNDMLANATKQRWSPRQLMEFMVRIEMDERTHRSLESRLRVARIRKFKLMAYFDWTWPTGIERDVIERALTLDFLIAKNICHAAALAGHSVLFRTASELLVDLQKQTPEGRLRKLRTYANVTLLCVDEVGYLNFDDKSADLLYEVINRRYEKKATVVTTNKPFKQWNEVFPNAACIVTMLDRLLHHAEVTVIEGSSYRMRESEQESLERRRSKS